MSLSKKYEKIKLKVLLRERVISTMIAKYRFYRWYDELKKMSLDSENNRMEDFNKLLISFKAVKTTTTTKETSLKTKRITKNLDEFYEKYYNAYKNDYDSEDELKIDEETKTFMKEIKEWEKSVDKKGFSGYFNNEPNALVSKLLSKNTQDFKKSLGGIKQ